MGLYNTMNGMTTATFIILPMLGKHPNEYPRFRDCFASDEEYPKYDNHIHVYTRVGGGNRSSYSEEIAGLRAMPGYVTDYDDSFDSTFASFVFSVPESFCADYDRICAGEITETSPEYRKMLYDTFPKLHDKFDKLFAGLGLEDKL